MDLLGPQGHPLDGPVSPNPDADREIRFFENPDFSFFRLKELKTLQYGCLLTPLDQPKLAVPQYCGTISVLFRYLTILFGT